MLDHVPILPVILPLIAGFVTLMSKRFGLNTQRTISVIAVVLLVVISLKGLYFTTLVPHTVYSLGDWKAPFGIVLVLDKLSIVMVLLTSILALGALWYSISEKVDSQSEHFHVLFQLQLFGINGAFLTGDLFNLFVFFEILLLASYSLLLHGSGESRTKAGLHYVVINLVGSTLFLFAVGALYGILGTLNIADLALKVSQLSSDNVSIVASAGLLLLVVFGLKAAMFPIYLWLPNAYSKTSAPVAALFAIMTKVGIYAIIRVHGTIFGENAGELAYFHIPWVLNIGLITLILATLGVLSSKDLKTQVAYVVLASVSVLLVSIGINTAESLSATIYYMIHSTLTAGVFFLVADIIVRQRGGTGDIMTKTAPFELARLTGGMFFVIGIAAAGLPPLSGFFGKVMILNSAVEDIQVGMIFTLLILSSLLIVVALARSGSNIFYDTEAEKETMKFSINNSSLYAIAFLFMFLPVMVIFANPVTEFTNTIGSDLTNTANYIESTLGVSMQGGR
jgi:multicomponent K+:H+ antiporter subunit D